MFSLILFLSLSVCVKSWSPLFHGVSLSQILDSVRVQFLPANFSWPHKSLWIRTFPSSMPTSQSNVVNKPDEKVPNFLFQALNKEHGLWLQAGFFITVHHPKTQEVRVIFSSPANFAHFSHHRMFIQFINSQFGYGVFRQTVSKSLLESRCATPAALSLSPEPWFKSQTQNTTLVVQSGKVKHS